MKQRHPWILPAVSLALFLGIAWVIHRELAHLSLAIVLDQLRALPRHAVLLAIAGVFASYVVLSGYDWLALRHLHRPVPYPHVLLTAFIAYVFAQNFGFAALTGGAVRYRLYAAHGLGALHVAGIALFSSLTTALGVCAVTGVSLLFAPAHAMRVLHLPGAPVALLGVGLLAVPLAYVLLAFHGPHQVAWRGWALRIPRPSVAVPQVVVAALDLAFVGVLLWLLLPPAVGVGPLAFVGIYAIAIVAATLSHVPGGLGVLESVIVIALPQIDAEQVVGALIAWRVIQYLLPLLVATTAFSVHQLRGR
ncbi:MAG: lysylphosphatidylglycerol synthase domain-containing protein [Steroidobacteraceae bacterium]